MSKFNYSEKLTMLYPTLYYITKIEELYDCYGIEDEEEMIEQFSQEHLDLVIEFLKDKPDFYCETIDRDTYNLVDQDISKYKIIRFLDSDEDRSTVILCF